MEMPVMAELGRREGFRMTAEALARGHRGSAMRSEPDVHVRRLRALGAEAETMAEASGDRVTTAASVDEAGRTVGWDGRQVGDGPPEQSMGRAVPERSERLRRSDESGPARPAETAASGRVDLRPSGDATPAGERKAVGVAEAGGPEVRQASEPPGVAVAPRTGPRDGEHRMDAEPAEPLPGGAERATRVPSRARELGRRVLTAESGARRSRELEGDLEELLTRLARRERLEFAR